MNDGDRFSAVVTVIAGKRLTYAQLTGKVGEAGEPTVVEIDPTWEPF